MKFPSPNKDAVFTEDDQRSADSHRPIHAALNLSVQGWLGITAFI